jgi:hypothetical protein
LILTGGHVQFKIQVQVQLNRSNRSSSRQRWSISHRAEQWALNVISNDLGHTGAGFRVFHGAKADLLFKTNRNEPVTSRDEVRTYRFL